MKYLEHWWNYKEDMYHKLGFAKNGIELSPSPESDGICRSMKLIPLWAALETRKKGNPELIDWII